MADKDDVAQAATELVGSLLGIDAFVNAVNLGATLTGASNWADSLKLRRSIRARLTMATKASGEGSNSDDIQAALDCMAATFGALPPNDDLARAVASRETLSVYVSSKIPTDHPAMFDPATRKWLDLFLREVCDAISVFIVRSPKYSSIVTAQTIVRADAIELRQKASESETRANSRQLENLDAKVGNLAAIVELYPALASSTPFLGTIDVAGRLFLGRDDDLRRLDELSARERCVVLVGQPMVGTTDLAKHWILNKMTGQAPSYAIDCQSETSFTGDLVALSQSLGRTGIPSLTDILNGPLSFGLLFDGVASESMLHKVLATVESVTSPERRAYAITSRFRPSGPPSRYFEVKPLSDEIVEGLFESLLPDATGLDELTEAVGGLPLLAVQAASLIAETGLSAEEYAKLLHEDPASTLRASTLMELGPSRNAAAIWDSAIARTGELTGIDACVPLGILREVGGTWPVGLMEGSLGFFLTGTDQLANQATVKASLAVLRRMVLLDEDSGRCSATAGLMDYAWHRMTPADHAAVHNGILRAAQLVATAARPTLDSGLVSHVAHVLPVPLLSWRDSDAELVLRAVIALANALRQADYPEAAVWLLSNCLEDESARLSREGASQIASILAVTLLEEDLTEGSEFSKVVYDDYLDAGEPPASSTRVNCMMALESWQGSDLAAADAYLDKAESGISQVLGEHDGDFARFNIARLRFQVWSALGKGSEALTQLQTALEVSESLGFELMRHDLLLDSVQLLTAQGVSVPRWLSQQSNAGLQASLKRQRDTVPGHAVWYFAGVADGLLQNTGSPNELDSWLQEPIVTPLDEETNHIHNAFRIHIDVKRRLDRAENLGVIQFILRTVTRRDAKPAKVFTEILDLIDAGLSLVEPRANLEVGWRAKRLRATFWHHRGSCYSLMGDHSEARKWLRMAYDFDVDEYGLDHSEVAYDALALSGVSSTAGEAAEWARIALSIFDRPGRHRDAPKAGLLKGLPLLRAN